HVPISYEILSAKAKQFYTETYGNDNFAASRSWISNFRKRHGLRSLKVCGEKLSNNQIAVNPVITVLAGKIKELDLTATQIYNADESALYWKMLPEKTLKVSSEVLQKCWHKILPQVTNNEADTEYEAEDLIPLNQLRRNMLSLAEEITYVSDMLNILTEHNQNLTNME
ncbi:hypothetical protein NQ318_013228, partial [Aromia moschata]